MDRHDFYSNKQHYMYSSNGEINYDPYNQHNSYNPYVNQNSNCCQYTNPYMPRGNNYTTDICGHDEQYKKKNMCHREPCNKYNECDTLCKEVCCTIL